MDKTTSDSIRVARVLCISSMISVHFWPGATRVLNADVGWIETAFFTVIIDYLGRGSVPLLSIVSGVLLVQSLRKNASATDFLGGKARALLIPMVVWSAVILAITILHAVATNDLARLPQDAMGWINSLFAVTAPPANIPLAFLRDVFLAAIFGYVALMLIRRAPPAGWALLAIIPAIEVFWDGAVFLRPQIVAFFAFGILIAVKGWTDIRPPWTLILAILTVEVIVRFAPLFDFPAADAAGHVLIRVAMLTLMWRFAVAVSERRGRLYETVTSLEPYVFLIFCSHMLVVIATGVACGALKINETSAVYPLIFLAQFPMSIVTAIGLSVMGERYAPGALAFVSGKRLKTA